MYVQQWACHSSLQNGLPDSCSSTDDFEPCFTAYDSDYPVFPTKTRQAYTNDIKSDLCLYASSTVSSEVDFFLVQGKYSLPENKLSNGQFLPVGTKNCNST